MKLCYDQDHVKIYHGDARDLDLIGYESVGLIVTSPPYYNARDYSIWGTYAGYLYDMKVAWEEAYRVLCDGGRICVNVPHIYGRPNNDGGKCYAIEADTTHALISVGFELRGVIIWVKPSSVVSSSTAWGSWKSASNPSLRDQHEVIIVCHKGSVRRAKGESTISAEDFTNWTRSIWEIQPVNSWHPAPFPAEIPKRLIQLYSYKNDIVLDPFSGSGTSVFTAAQLGREGIGVEASLDYIKQSCGPLLMVEEA